MSFQVHGKDLLGRIGTIKTKSGSFTTPHMFPVLDPTSRMLSKDFFDRAGIKAVMTNAYLLRRARRETGHSDVHKVLDYESTIATDSGAYQILEYGAVGVKPGEIIEYQEEINTDIGVILDIPTGYHSSPERARWTVDETVRRADEGLRQMTRKDILWMGPVQGGIYINEVKRSAQAMSERDFPIYALGSPTELMETQRFDVLVDMIVAAKRQLPADKPFHLFGAGHPALFPFLVALGCDLFDSAAYALYARKGRYLTPEGTLLLGEMSEFSCLCPTCVDTTPNEVMMSNPSDREKQLIQHNLWVCFSELGRIREAIRSGRLWELLELRAHIHPSMTKCFARIREYSDVIEKSTPAVKPHGIFFFGESTGSRPENVRYISKLPGAALDRKKLVLLLPGRWRRPFHEDPRYESVSKTFQDQEKVSICFYSISYGPVPLELDETFPIAQTESADPKKERFYKARAYAVTEYLRKLSPVFLVVGSEGDYGKVLAKEVVRVFSKRRTSVLSLSRMKPQSIIRAINKRVADLT